MFSIPPPFWLKPSGDHPTGDGLTALQTSFAGGSAADVSGNSEPVTINDPTGLRVGLYDGYVEIDFQLGTPTNIGVYWGGAGPRFARASAGQAYTVEYFFMLMRHPNANNQSAQTLVNLDNLTAAMNGGSAPIGWSKTANWSPPTHSYFSSFYGSPANVSLPLDTMQHVAFTWGADNKWRAFRNGTLIAGPVTDSSAWLIGNVYAGFYSPSIPFHWTDFTYRGYGMRVRRAKMYADGGFTPPASPAAWGPA